ECDEFHGNLSAACCLMGDRHKKKRGCSSGSSACTRDYRPLGRPSGFCSRLSRSERRLHTSVLALALQVHSRRQESPNSETHLHDPASTSYQPSRRGTGERDGPEVLRPRQQVPGMTFGGGRG